MSTGMIRTRQTISQQMLLMFMSMSTRTCTITGTYPGRAMTMMMRTIMIMVACPITGMTITVFMGTISQPMALAKVVWGRDDPLMSGLSVRGVGNGTRSVKRAS